MKPSPPICAGSRNPWRELSPGSPESSKVNRASLTKVIAPPLSPVSFANYRCAAAVKPCDNSSSMQNILLATCFLFGLALGLLVAWTLLRPAARLAHERAKAEWEPERAVLNERLQTKEQQYKELQTALDDARQKLTDTFKALSAEALQSNNQAFLDLAKTVIDRTQETARGDLELRQQAIAALVRPVRESLDQVQSRIQDLETARSGAYAGLSEQVRGLLETQVQLRSETSRLATAFRSPGVRGRWGEIQLKRVVEMAGMLERCDFCSSTNLSV